MRAILTLALVLWAASALAVGAPNYLPDGPHPRIILTSAELSSLAAKRAANTAEWAALVSWCDAHISDTGYDTQPTELGYGGVIAYGQANWEGTDYFGYRMSGFADHLKNYALAYQVLKQPGTGQDLTKAQAYAARVRTLLIDGIAKGLNVGAEWNGLRAIRVSDLADVSVNSAEVAALAGSSESLPGQVSNISYKLGYSTRFLASVPIAYDWIQDTLSADDKALLSAMMLRWYDWIQGVRSTYNNGVLINGVRYYEDYGGTADSTHINPASGKIVKASDFGLMYSNFGSGHEALMSLIPVALYGDNADVPAYFTQTMSRMSSVVDQLDGALKQSGGESVEGWNYGSGYQYLLPSLYGFHTATGDALIGSLQWPSALLDAMVHRVQANLLDVPYYGYWTGTPMGVNRMSFALPFIGVNQRLNPSATLSGAGQYLLKNVTWGESGTLFDKALWYLPDAATVNPSTLPLSYRAQGGGFLTSRSSWSDPNAVHVLAILRGLAGQANHEGYSQGHFSVARGTDRLLSHSNDAGDSPGAVSFNTIVFNNANSHANNPVLTTPAVDRVEDVNGHFYVSADLTNAYKRQYQADKVKLFRRSMLHIRPGFVVIRDVTRSNSALGNLKDWYTQYTTSPTTSGDTISAVTGSSKVYVKTLAPSGGNYTVTNPYSGSYRVKYTPAVTQEYDQFLHVIEATGSASAQTVTTLITGTGGSGALIADPTENKVVMFTSDQGGANITNLTYSVDTSAASRHYIADLAPNANYTVSIDGGAAVTYTASSAGVIEFVNLVHSPHTYSVTQTGAAPVTPTTHRAGSVRLVGKMQ